MDLGFILIIGMLIGHAFTRAAARRRATPPLPAAEVLRLPEGIREVSAASSERIPFNGPPLRFEPGPRTVRLSNTIPYAQVSEVGSVAPSVRDITQAGARMEMLRELHERGDITDAVFAREMRRVSEPVNRALDGDRTYPRRPAGWAGNPMPGEARARAYTKPPPTAMPGPGVKRYG